MFATDPRYKKFSKYMTTSVPYCGRCPQLPACLQICEAYGANRYPFPEDSARRRQMMAEVTARLQELHTTIDASASLLSVLGHQTATQMRIKHAEHGK